MIRLPTASTPLSSVISNNPKFFPYFDKACGAINGSHLDAYMTLSTQARRWDRKGRISTNCLAASTFDMLFCFVFSGWEGSAADSFLFHHAWEHHGFTISAGWYYLADAGFPSCDALLALYRGVWYHL